VSDTYWSKAVLLLPRENIEAVGKLHPTFLPNRFEDALQAKQMGFLEKLEHTLAASQIDKREGLEWFRFAVQGGLPHGPPLEQILADLEDLSYRTPDAGHQILDAGVIPADVYYSVAMGSDIGHMPVQTLVDFDGLPHCQTATKSATICEGNYIIVQGKKRSQLPIVLGVVVQCPRQTLETWYCTSRSLLLNYCLHCTLLATITSCLHVAVVLIPVNKDDNLESEAFVQWYHPQQSQIANRRAGRKSQLLDIFGNWVPSSRMALQDLEPLPSPRVKAVDVIDWDFEVEDSEGGVLIPFSTLDRVMEYGIDITGLNVSQTRRGNLYRTHRLMQPALQR